MRFSRITENRAYEAIATYTLRLRRDGFGYREISENPKIVNLGLNFERCVSAGIGPSGEGEFSGTIVTGEDEKFRVISIYIDTLSPRDTDVSDITDSIGELDPRNPKCDIRNPIAMAIIYYLEEFSSIPKNVERYLKHK